MLVYSIPVISIVIRLVQMIPKIKYKLDLI